MSRVSRALLVVVGALSACEGRRTPAAFGTGLTVEGGVVRLDERVPRFGAPGDGVLGIDAVGELSPLAIAGWRTAAFDATLDRAARVLEQARSLVEVIDARRAEIRRRSRLRLAAVGCTPRQADQLAGRGGGHGFIYLNGAPEEAALFCPIHATQAGARYDRLSITYRDPDGAGGLDDVAAVRVDVVAIDPESSEESVLARFDSNKLAGATQTVRTEPVSLLAALEPERHYHLLRVVLFGEPGGRAAEFHGFELAEAE